jgi:hypothetical protein
MRQLFSNRRPDHKNLLPYQQFLLNHLRKSDDLIIIPSDKNLGPVVLKRERTIYPTPPRTVASHQLKPLPPSNKLLMTYTASLPTMSLDLVTTITSSLLARLPLLTIFRLFIYLSKYTRILGLPVR